MYALLACHARGSGFDSRHLRQKTNTMAKTKKGKTKFLSVKIHCSNLDKEVDLDMNQVHYSSSESECEICGSHGSVKLKIDKCKCGKSHTVELDSW